MFSRRKFPPSGYWRAKVMLLLLLLLVMVSDRAAAAAAAAAASTVGSSSTTITTTANQQQTASSSSSQQQQHEFLRSVARRDLQVGQEKAAVNIQEYELIPPAEIKELVYKWADHYSDFVQLTTAQEAYGLPAAGGDNVLHADCPFDPDIKGCKNYILKLQDYEAYPVGSDASKRLPEVLLSGELHGNEQVGPTAVLEATNLLLQAAECERHPRLELMPSWLSSSNPWLLSSDTTLKPKLTKQDLNVLRAWRAELARAKSCRQELREFGISDKHRKWLARLLATRRIVVVPTANALGYYRKKREEGYIDPNRDFPYEQNPESCMQTIAGRTLNEIFREHMFQLSLTFHGGMEVVGYEWGAPHWRGHLSPDDSAQKGIGAAYSHYGGNFKTSPNYNFGTMNELVYPVTGGMEDWAYAASWDPDRVTPCTPNTFGGYPAEKTIYNNSTLRVFNMLIETSNNKIPHKSSLGTSQNVLTGDDSQHNGHVARNIRLSLLAAELVQPYLSLVKVNDYLLSDDIIPTQKRHNEDPVTQYSCHSTHGISVAVPETKTLTIEWNVGGVLTIDQTTMWYGLWKDVMPGRASSGSSSWGNGTAGGEALLDCWTPPHDVAALEAVVKKATPVSATSGLGAFSAQNRESVANNPPFSASLDLTGFQTGDVIFAIAMAEVDGDWKDQPSNILPQMPPQSHIVNARTNDDWYHETENSIIQGRTRWFSQPLTIRVGHFNNNAAKQGIQEILSRFPPEAEQANYDLPPDDTINGGQQVSSAAGRGGGPSSGTYQQQSGGHHGLLDMVALVGVLAVAFFVARAIQQRSSFRSAHRTRVREFIQDESLESPGLEENGNGRTYEDHPDDEDSTDHRGEVELGSYKD